MITVISFRLNNRQMYYTDQEEMQIKSSTNFMKGTVNETFITETLILC